ncbi:MAG TPA: isochorismatase family cysteine hydrolase [Thermodesulfobacteriota bacterium]
MLVIDMQRDFLEPGAPAETVGGLALVPRINRLTAAARSAGVPVIFTHERHRPDLSDFGIELEYEAIHCIEGTPGAELVAGLTVAPGDYHITSKRRYDAFEGTDLDGLLRMLGVRQLVVAGVCTDVCVSATVQRARNLNYRVFLVEDGVAATSLERHRAALLCLSHVFCRLTTVADAERAFGAAAAGRP